MAVFGKRKRSKRALPERGRLPDPSAPLEAPPLPQKRLKIAMILLLGFASLYVIHAGHLIPM
ncbi:MAG: hypothetical protein ACYS47_21150, partial [Planctomycetota bacterium]